MSSSLTETLPEKPNRIDLSAQQSARKIFVGWHKLYYYVQFVPIFKSAGLPFAWEKSRIRAARSLCFNSFSVFYALLSPARNAG